MRWLLPVAVAVALWPTSANAQAVYGQRLQGQGGWLLPVASRLLCSDSAMHVRRNSIPSWDICAPNGSAIYAAAPGRVIYAGCNNAGGYGCWVKLDHGGGITSAYAHMIIGSIMVQTGQQVDQSTVLGQIGWTGQTSFGPHVHFVIYKNGVHIDPAQVFSQQAMQFCDKCAAPGDTPVAANGVVGAMAQPQAQVSNLATCARGVLAAIGSQTVAAMAVLVFLLAATLFWLGGLYTRVVVVSVGSSSTVAVLVIWFVVISTPTQTATAQSVITGSETWKVAYVFTRQSEGARCVHDPVRTLKGITQGTYDRYLRDMGVGPADVCTSLTEQQAEQIYYRYYWQTSGAAQIAQQSPTVAITFFDMAVNAGNGVARDIYARCGNNAKCFNDARESFYRSARGCSLYCAGWLNRLARIRQITEG